MVKVIEIRGYYYEKIGLINFLQLISYYAAQDSKHIMNLQFGFNKKGFLCHYHSYQ